jgi:N-acetylglutamate synthase-like GNAT family acetyltransferase
MGHTLQVRKAVLTDLEAVFELAKDFVMSFPISKSAFEESYQKLIVTENALLLVIEEDNNVLGYCLAMDHLTFFANGRITWLEEITIKQDKRGLGLGHKLMDAVEAWASSRNSKLVALATRRAAEFYKSLNYEESAVYFRKILNNS